MVMESSSSAGGGQHLAGWSWPAVSWGSATAGENLALTMIMAGDDGVSRRHLVEDIAFAVGISSLVLLRGNPRSRIPDQTMSTLRCRSLS
jgi:hypothetical protein